MGDSFDMCGNDGKRTQTGVKETQWKSLVRPRNRWKDNTKNLSQIVRAAGYRLD